MTYSEEWLKGCIKTLRDFVIIHIDSKGDRRLALECLKDLEGAVIK